MRPNDLMAELSQSAEGIFAIAGPTNIQVSGYNFKTLSYKFHSRIPLPLQISQSAKDVFTMMGAAIILVIILALVNYPLAKCVYPAAIGQRPAA